jgi:hypothetical protein
MNAKQYTIRNIPPQVDRYLRKQVRLSGKSLNQVVISELSVRAGVSDDSVTEALDWFIGSGLDKKTSQALAREDAEQKRLMRHEWQLDT